MYLSRLYIDNYRSIKKLDLKFEKGKNIIVGKNNSGKSNIIKAIDLILGESSPTWDKSNNITDNDFFEGDVKNEIFIFCELFKESTESLNLSNVKGAFFKLMNKHTFEVIKLNVDFSHKNNLFRFCTDEGQEKIDETYRKKWIGTKKYCKRGFEDELDEMNNFAFAFSCKKVGEMFVKNLTFLYKKSEETDWFFAINANLRNELLQSAIIPSFRDPNSQLRITNYSWYGKLLKECINKDDTDLKNAFSKVKDASNKIFKKLEDTITCEKTQIAFPNTKISFQFNPDTNQDIYKSTLIYVDDGFNSKLGEKGSGIQSAVIIALFDYYIRHIAHQNSSLLAIEEPEIYLHPHGRRVISDRLDTFLDSGKNQVILSTHSPEFISSPHENINLIVVRKDGETRAYNQNFTDVKTKQVLIKKQNAEMFFADAVILVEGSDKYILEAIAEEFGNKTSIRLEKGQNILGKSWLNDYNVSIINCGGKTEFWKYVTIFNEIDIPWLIIADFDFIREGLNAFYTKLSYKQYFSDNLNSLKSKISITGKYKSISDIVDGNVKIQINEYLSNLSEHYCIHILTGELEDFYKEKPKYSKEAGVIETISKQLEENKSIKEFIEVTEFENALKVFVQKCFKLKLIEEKFSITEMLQKRTGAKVCQDQ